jgi:methionine synthase II (cobalamin-independent)
MPDLEFGLLSTMIGSVPHKNAEEACRQVTRYLKDIPCWPQLPGRAFLENMYVQYSEGYPGVVVDTEKDRIYIDREGDNQRALEQLYNASIENDIDRFPISEEYATGLYAFLGIDNMSPLAVKGQVTGPISWGLTVTDKDKKSIIYDDVYGDAAARLLKLKAGWMEKVLQKVSRNTIIFIDEPYMVSYGSAFVSISREKVIGLLEEVLSGISGIKGAHCCGNTDWSVLLDTSIDILSFDTYNYAESLTLYPAEVKRFLDRGGVISWGVVPNESDTQAKETVASLKDRLEEAMAPFTRNGVRFEQLVRQGLITPSCTLTPLSEEECGRALELLVELSETMRKRYL